MCKFLYLNGRFSVQLRVKHLAQGHLESMDKSLESNFRGSEPEGARSIKDWSVLSAKVLFKQ